MPSVKAKTHKGTKQRFKVTATGKVMHRRCGSSHLNSGNTGSKTRKLRRKGVLVVQAEARRLRRALRVHKSSLTNGIKYPPIDTLDTPSSTSSTEAETAPATQE